MSQENYAYGKKYLPKINTKMVNSVNKYVPNISNPENTSINQEKNDRLPRISKT